MRKSTHVNKIKPLTMSVGEIVSGFATGLQCGLMSVAALWCNGEVQCPVTTSSLLVWILVQVLLCFVAPGGLEPSTN